MTYTVRETFRQFLPGAGRNTSGGAVQGKTRVVGQITVSAYTRAGESLTAQNLGLSAIDYISLRVKNEVPGADGKHRLGVTYAADSSKFYIFDVDAAGSVTHFALGSSNEVIQFVAEGDSLFDVELT